MLSRLKENLYRRISDELPRRPTYPAAMLTGPDLPTDIGHFLSQTLIRRAQLEGGTLLRQSSDWFDFDAEPVQAVVDGFIQSLTLLAHFPQKEFDPMLRKAIHACADYLVNPVQTLATFAVTDRPDDNTSGDVRRRSGYFLHYGYLLAAVETYLSGAPDGQIDRDALYRHLNSVETSRLGAETVDDWMQLLTPLTNAARFAFREEASVPVELIVEFFAHKEQSELARSVGALKKSGTDLVTPEQIAVALKSVLEPEPVPAPIFPPSAHSGAENRTRDSQAALPLWKQFAKEGQTTTSDVLKNPSGEAPAEPLWKAYRKDETPASPQTTGATSTESQILGKSVSHRNQFIEDLFGGDNHRYTAFFERVSNAPNWETASSILMNDVYRPNEIDIYSDTAVAFTNAVERGIKQRS